MYSSRFISFCRGRGRLWVPYSFEDDFQKISQTTSSKISDIPIQLTDVKKSIKGFKALVLEEFAPGCPTPLKLLLWNRYSKNMEVPKLHPPSKSPCHGHLTNGVYVTSRFGALKLKLESWGSLPLGALLLWNRYSKNIQETWRFPDRVLQDMW